MKKTLIIALVFSSCLGLVSCSASKSDNEIINDAYESMLDSLYDDDDDNEKVKPTPYIKIKKRLNSEDKAAQQELLDNLNERISRYKSGEVRALMSYTTSNGSSQFNNTGDYLRIDDVNADEILAQATDIEILDTFTVNESSGFRAGTYSLLKVTYDDFYLNGVKYAYDALEKGIQEGKYRYGDDYYIRDTDSFEYRDVMDKNVRTEYFFANLSNDKQKIDFSGMFWHAISGGCEYDYNGTPVEVVEDKNTKSSINKIMADGINSYIKELATLNWDGFLNGNKQYYNLQSKPKITNSKQKDMLYKNIGEIMNVDVVSVDSYSHREDKGKKDGKFYDEYSIGMIATVPDYNAVIQPLLVKEYTSEKLWKELENAITNGSVPTKLIPLEGTIAYKDGEVKFYPDDVFEAIDELVGTDMRPLNYKMRWE